MTRVFRRAGGSVALAACAVLALAASGGPASGAEPIRVSSPVQATKFDSVPSRQYGTPDLAIDPENKLNVVATLPDLPSKRCGLIRSTDGGVTWSRLDASPSTDKYPFCLMQGNSNVTQALLAFGRNHTLYYAFTGWDTPDGEDNGSVFVARSTDLGKSWATTLVRDNRAATNPRERDRPISGLAVDSKTGSADTVIVGWRLEPIGTESPNEASRQPMVAVSTDGAKTFAPALSLATPAFDNATLRADAIKSSPTTTAPAPGASTTTVPANSKKAQPNQVGNFGGSNPTVAVDDKGTIYAAWVSSTVNISPSPLFSHILSTSTDKGKTWTHTQMTPFSDKNTNGYNAMHLAWSPKGGAQGSLHFTYDASDRPKIANLNQATYIRSTDGGKTWSTPKVLADVDPAKLTYSGDTMVRVAPNGRVDATWWDTRNDPGIAANDVYYAYSDDGGATWSKNIRVTDRVINRKIGVFGNNFDLAGPPGLASTDDFTIFGWDDTRNGDPILNTQDIYVGSVQFTAVASGGTSALAYILAAVLGVLVVGVVLFIAAYRTRARGGTDPTRAPSTPEKVSAP